MREKGNVASKDIEDLSNRARGFPGDEPERLSYDRCIERINEKGRKLAGCQASDAYWLFLYDNFSIPGTRIEEIVADLEPVLATSGFATVALVNDSFVRVWKTPSQHG